MFKVYALESITCYAKEALSKGGVALIETTHFNGNTQHCVMVRKKNLAYQLNRFFKENKGISHKVVVAEPYSRGVQVARLLKNAILQHGLNAKRHFLNKNGFKRPANVPPELQSVCLTVAAEMWEQLCSLKPAPAQAKLPVRGFVKNALTQEKAIQYVEAKFAKNEVPHLAGLQAMLQAEFGKKLSLVTTSRLLNLVWPIVISRRDARKTAKVYTSMLPAMQELKPYDSFMQWPCIVTTIEAPVIKIKSTF